MRGSSSVLHVVPHFPAAVFGMIPLAHPLVSVASLVLCVKILALAPGPPSDKGVNEVQMQVCLVHISVIFIAQCDAR